MDINPSFYDIMFVVTMTTLIYCNDCDFCCYNYITFYKNILIIKGAHTIIESGKFFG